MLPVKFPCVPVGKRNRLVASSLCFYETSETDWMSRGPYVSMNTLTCKPAVIYGSESRMPHYIALQSIAKVVLIFNFDQRSLTTDSH